MDSGEKDYVQDPSTGDPGNLHYVIRCEGTVNEVAEVERKRMRMILRKSDEDSQRAQRSEERFLSFIQNVTNTQEKTQEDLPETTLGLVSEQQSVVQSEQSAQNNSEQNVPELEKRNSSGTDHTYSKAVSPEGAQGNTSGTSQRVPLGQRTAATVLHEIFKDVPEDPRPCSDGYIPLTNYIKTLNPAAKCKNHYESVEELTASMVKMSKCLRLREGSKLKREDIFKGFLPEYPAEPGYIERRYRHLLKQPQIPKVVNIKEESIAKSSSYESEDTVIYRPLTGSVGEYEASNSRESPGDPKSHQQEE